MGLLTLSGPQDFSSDVGTAAPGCPAAQVYRAARLRLPLQLAEWNRNHRSRFLVFHPDAKQSGLCFGMFPQFLHLVDDDSVFRLIFLALYPALGFVALFLLARLLFLSFSK